MNTAFDPHLHERYYTRWRKYGSVLAGVTEESQKLILAFLADMEIGANVNPSSKKGTRSFGRLRNLKSKMQTLSILFQKELSINSLADLADKELEILKFFKRMRDGEIGCRRYDKPLKAVGTYVRIFKTYWHWYQRSQRRLNNTIPDITLDLDCRDVKPKFCYFTIDDVKKLCNEANYEYRVMMMFLFDSGIRAPTEFMNVRVCDLEWNNEQKYYVLTIREETAKTFGRKIKLLLCPEILKEYITKRKLEGQDPIFRKCPQRVNQYLRNLGYKVLKLGIPTEKKYPNGSKQLFVKEGITMYDFRHCSACYWLPKYKSESALKYRFGWKKSEMIHYYTELLGMKDTIETDDLYTDITKTELESQLQQKGHEIQVMQEKMQEQEIQMAEILCIVKALQLETKDKIPIIITSEVKT